MIIRQTYTHIHSDHSQEQERKQKGDGGESNIQVKPIAASIFPKEMNRF